MWDPSTSLDDQKKTKTLKKKKKVFPYTNNEHPKIKIKSTKPFITMPEKKKHLRMYLTNCVKEMHVES